MLAYSCHILVLCGKIAFLIVPEDIIAAIAAEEISAREQVEEDRPKRKDVALVAVAAGALSQDLRRHIARSAALLV